MTREDWVRIKSSGSIPVSVWFDYYRDKGGTIQDIAIFQQCFEHIVNGEQPVIMGRMVNPTTARRRLFDYYDSMFGIYE